MKLLLYRPLVIVSILIVIVAVLLTNLSFRKFCCSGEYKTYTKPDNNYTIKIYRYNVFYMVMPGGAGDAPGYVRLYNKNNELMKEKEIEMVQLADTVEWSDNRVYIKFIADWELTE